MNIHTPQTQGRMPEKSSLAKVGSGYGMVMKAATTDGLNPAVIVTKLNATPRLIHTPRKGKRQGVRAYKNVNLVIRVIMVAAQAGARADILPTATNVCFAVGMIML
jgi:hypothetical protein